MTHCPLKKDALLSLLARCLRIVEKDPRYNQLTIDIWEAFPDSVWSESCLHDFKEWEATTHGDPE